MAKTKTKEDFAGKVIILNTKEIKKYLERYNTFKREQNWFSEEELESILGFPNILADLASGNFSSKYMVDTHENNPEIVCTYEELEYILGLVMNGKPLRYSVLEFLSEITNVLPEFLAEVRELTPIQKLGILFESYGGFAETLISPEGCQELDKLLLEIESVTHSEKVKSYPTETIRFIDSLLTIRVKLCDIRFIITESEGIDLININM